MLVRWLLGILILLSASHGGTVQTDDDYDDTYGLEERSSVSDFTATPTTKAPTKTPTPAPTSAPTSAPTRAQLRLAQTQAPTRPPTNVPTTSAPTTSAPTGPSCCEAAPLNSTCDLTVCKTEPQSWALSDQTTVCGETACCETGAYPQVRGLNLTGLFELNLTATCTDCCFTRLYGNTSEMQLDDFFNSACGTYCNGQDRQMAVPFGDDGSQAYCQPKQCCLAENSYDAGIPVTPKNITAINQTTGLLDVRKDTCLDCCTQSPYSEGMFFWVGSSLTHRAEDTEFEARCAKCGGVVQAIASLSGRVTEAFHCYQPNCCSAGNYSVDLLNRTDFTYTYTGPKGPQTSTITVPNITAICPPHPDFTCCSAAPVYRAFSSDCQRACGAPAELWYSDGTYGVCGSPGCCTPGTYVDLPRNLNQTIEVLDLTAACTDCCFTRLHTASFSSSRRAGGTSGDGSGIISSYIVDSCKLDCNGTMVRFNDSRTSGYCQPQACACQAENSYRWWTYQNGQVVEDDLAFAILMPGNVGSEAAERGVGGLPLTEVDDDGVLDVRDRHCLDCCTQFAWGPSYLGENDTLLAFFEQLCGKCNGTVKELEVALENNGVDFTYHCHQPACCSGYDYPSSDVTAYTVSPYARRARAASGLVVANISAACEAKNFATSAPTKAPTSAPTKAPTSAPTTTAAPVAEVCLAGEYLESSGPCAGRCFPCKSKVVYNKNDPNFGESGVFPLPDAPSECQKCGITNGECDKNRKENNKCDELSGYYNEAAPCRKFTSTDNSWYNLCEWEANGRDPEFEIIIVKERIGQCYPCDSTYNPPDAPREILQCSPETCNVNFNRNTVVEMPTIKGLILNIIGIRSLPVTGTYLLLGLGIVFI